MSKPLSSSEWVSLGHPDRLSDLIAAIIINDIQHKDGYSSHAAVEVFITHTHVVISGEVRTTLDINDDYLKKVVADAYRRAGYLPEMRKYWTKEEVMIAEDMQIINMLQAQSPDIALGTTDKADKGGWNDVGVMFSSSEGTNKQRLGIPMLIATKIGEALHEYSAKSILDGENTKITEMLGPDIKVVVTCSTTDLFHCDEIKAVTISQSHRKDCSIDAVRSFVKTFATRVIMDTYNQHHCKVAEDCRWVINGTGAFTVMGNVSDTSMTGRKISVNHPSAGPLFCNKMIGGGSLVKCYHASDFILNVATRFVSNVIVRAGIADFAVVGVSCAIGRNELQSMFIYSNIQNQQLIEAVKRFFEQSIDWSVTGLTEMFGILKNDFDYSDVVASNFFGHPERSQTWEGDLVGRYAWDLLDYLNK